jgi:cytochrome P450
MTDPMLVRLRDKAFWQDPYPTLDAARAQHRTAVSESGEPVILSIADLEAISADPNMVPLGLDALERLGITDGPFYEWRRLSINARNHDDHKRLRGLVGRAFTPMQVQRVRPLVREHAERLLDRVVEAGTMEVQNDYARDVPLYAICVFLGVPEEDRHEIEALHFGTEEGFGWPMTPERRARAESGIVGLYDYSCRLVERRRREPLDDLVSALVHVEEHGDRLAEDELHAMVVNLIGGAIGSTQSAIANGAFLFASHPAQAQLLRENPERARAATEEVLRYAPPFRSTRRKALTPMSIGRHTLQAGQAVFLSRQAANRDPERFARQNEFDITRKETGHASFGHGPHFCLGQALARANLMEAIPALVQRCHNLELVGSPIRIPFDPVERFDALHVGFQGVSRA